MNTSTFTSASKRTRGLALVELMVVLLILALLAGTAITATEGLVEESHYDATRTTLERVEEAILGPYAPPTAHDDTMLAGFVADVGRLPRLTGTVDTALLSELWLQPPVEEVVPFFIQTPPGDPTLRIPGGWRGPYLHLGFGTAGLFDGWGRALRVFKNDGTLAIAGDVPGRIASLGANGEDGGTGDYDVVTPLTIARTITTANDPAVTARHVSSLRVSLEPAVEGGSMADVLVRVYAPARRLVDGVDGVVRAVDQHHFSLSTETSFLFEGDEIPVGSRVVRAYHLPAADPAPGFEDDTIELIPRSAPVTVRVVSRGTPDVVLKIWALAPPPSDER